jgi:hypothetical protein
VRHEPPARRDEFTADLEAIQKGLATSLGKDAEFVEAMGCAFKQISAGVAEEAEVDAQLQSILDESRRRETGGHEDGR